MDTLLLAGVLEKFRTCLGTYNLDPTKYFTSPELSFDALLKRSKVKLEYIEDPEVLLFIEKRIREGIPQ